MASRDLHKLLTPASGAELDALYEEIVGKRAPDVPMISEKPLFLQAAERRAKVRGITAEQLLTDYSKRLSESTYPTPDCLAPDEVQRFCEGAELAAAQKEHIAACEPCQDLLEVAQLSSERIQGLMEEVRLVQRVRNAIGDLREHSDALERQAVQVSRQSTVQERLEEDPLASAEPCGQAARIRLEARPWVRGAASDVTMCVAGAVAALAVVRVSEPVVRQLALTRPASIFWLTPLLMSVVVVLGLAAAERWGGFISRLGVLRWSVGAAFGCFCLMLFAGGFLGRQRAAQVREGLVADLLRNSTALVAGEAPTELAIWPMTNWNVLVAKNATRSNQSAQYVQRLGSIGGEYALGVRDLDSVRTIAGSVSAGSAAIAGVATASVRNIEGAEVSLLIASLDPNHGGVIKASELLRVRCGDSVLGDLKKRDNGKPLLLTLEFEPRLGGRQVTAVFYEGTLPLRVFGTCGDGSVAPLTEKSK